VAKDYYEILGVSKQASADEIKRSFRNLARKYHPDVNREPGSAEKFKEINEAYQLLSDQQKRRQYDAFGTAQPGGFPGFDFGEGFGGFEGISDIFDAFFGTQTRRRGGRGTMEEAGADLRYDLAITLEEAANGLEKEIEIAHLTSCQTCKGTGAKPGTSPSRCSSCEGTGQVRRMQRTPLGSFTQISTCPTCHGAGSVIGSPCSACHGSGRVKARHKIKVKIPAGIDSGYRLRVSQAGEAGLRGGPPGDLYVFISVKPHSLFEREGADLYHKRLISFVQAALGDVIEVPTISGQAELRIPSGTQPNTTFRLKGKGLPHLRGGGRGDQFVVVEIETPTNLTDEQAELLRKFGKLRKEYRA
jgi:molecular chaperone DnaJ